MRPLALRHAVVASLLAATLVAVGCGDSNDDTGAAATSPATASKANGTDLAFVDEMITHHQSAIDMAKIAQMKGQHNEITDLAGKIIEAQMNEIEDMRVLGERFVNDGVKSSPLGMSKSEMGMGISMDALEKAKPFDRAFLTMMSDHHRGAIAMVRVELAKGVNPDVRGIAQAIVKAQQKEISQMAEWSAMWYSGDTGGTSGDEMDPGA